MENYKARIAYLDNKSRKGAYVYVSLPKNKGAYYKLEEDTPMDVYAQYYLDKHNKRRKPKGTLREYKQAFKGIAQDKRVKVSTSLKRFVTRKYSKAIKAKQSISANITKGITSTKLDNALEASDGDIRETYKRLLSPLVLDKQLLNLLTLEENIQKLVHRFEYKITLTDATGANIAMQTHIGKKSLRNVINDLQENYHKGMDFEAVYRHKKILGKNGYSYEQKESKKPLAKILIEIIFRY